MSLVVVPVHPVALGTSPEFVFRAATSTGLSAETAALDCFACSRASSRGHPRLSSCTGTLDWGPAGELRRPSSPAAAQRSLMSCAAGS
jgi:hypothetical protein